MNTRRKFLKDAVLGATALAVGWDAKSYARIAGANDRVQFGIIGLHGRGNAHLESVKAATNATVSFVCDVDRLELEKFGKAARDKLGRDPAKVTDFRRLLESRDVDVITIATPEHWQAHMAIAGLKAGKHVYVEKPSSHNPHEGELLVRAQKKYGKHVQLGNQQRSSPHTIEIMQKIRDGLIGRPYFGRAWYCNTRKSIGIGKEVAVPEHLDWELWQGPAPRRPYKDNIHPYNWHWFWHWGTGETLNNGTHEVDLCRWAMGVGYPRRISATGGRYHFHDDWEFYDTLETSYEYDDAMITWEGMSCQGRQTEGRGRGAAIHGTKGSVVMDRSGYQVFSLDNKKLDEYSSGAASPTSDLRSTDTMTDLHFQNLVNAIRDREALRSPIHEGNVAVTMLQLSNIAWKVNRSLRIDPSNGRVLDDPEASALCRREYEKGWELEL
jgi:predicted dehydrogenase